MRLLVLDEKQRKLRRYIRILQLLVETEAPLNKNRIRSKLEGKIFGSEPIILYAIDDLKKWRLIRLIKTNTPVPGGGTLNYYVPTRTGIENLISAGILLTESINTNTVKLLLQKYTDLLPYATQILELWPLFVEAGLEDYATRRLAMFIAKFHGEHLYNHVYNPSEIPIIADHALLDAKQKGAARKIGPLSLNCTASDDIEAFLDPTAYFQNIDTPDRYDEDEAAEWLQLIKHDERLQAIVARATLKDALSTIQMSNGILRELSNKSINLQGKDAEIYKKLSSEFDILSSKIVTE